MGMSKDRHAPPRLYTRKEALLHTLEHGSIWEVPGELGGFFERFDHARAEFRVAGPHCPEFSSESPSLLSKQHEDGWRMEDPGTDNGL